MQQCRWEIRGLPDPPLPYWGWGDIPDQYGRRWDGDDGESPPPTGPGLATHHPYSPCVPCPPSKKRGRVTPAVLAQVGGSRRCPIPTMTQPALLPDRHPPMRKREWIPGRT